MWKWACIRLPPLSKTYCVVSSVRCRTSWYLAEMGIAWAWDCHDLFQIAHYICSFQVGWLVLFGLYCCFLDDWDFPLMFLSLTVCDSSSGIVLANSRTGREVPEIRNQISCYTVSLLTLLNYSKDKLTLSFSWPWCLDPVLTCWDGTVRALTAGMMTHIEASLKLIFQANSLKGLCMWMTMSARLHCTWVSTAASSQKAFRNASSSPDCATCSMGSFTLRLCPGNTVWKENC